MVDFEASHDHDVKEMLLLSDSMTQKVIFTVNQAFIFIASNLGCCNGKPSLASHTLLNERKGSGTTMLLCRK